MKNSKIAMSYFSKLVIHPKKWIPVPGRPSPKGKNQIHGNPVADGWAGAVMQKTFGIQKCDGRTDGPTDGPIDRHGRIR